MSSERRTFLGRGKIFLGWQQIAGEGIASSDTVLT